jgi:Tol biopolymer transport system component
MNHAPCSSCGAVADVALSGLCAACLLRTPTDATPEEGHHVLGPGSTVGPYEIVSMLGCGGMGHVYLGWDARLCRTVAIKVLAPPFVADAERTRRLEREARIVAGLNHPRICAVHDVGCENGLSYVVMEHLEGETLAERMTRGPLPLPEALSLGVEIADGLDRAHRQGITHRDLKPANIMLTRSGVKLLDFGLAARAYSSETSESGPGGTVQYMAPEQLAGGNADARSDVFAFGLVLYEMLTAQRFQEAHGLSGPRPEVPPALNRIVRRCLRTDPEERWQSLRDVLFELAALIEESAGAGEKPRPALPKRRRLSGPLAATVAAALVASVLGALVVPAVADHPSAYARAIRFAATMPRPASDVVGAGGMAVVSPDGLSLVWTSASGDGKTVLAVRAFDATDPTVLVGTDDARWPFWSPDSRAIAFFAQGELRRVRAAGGPVETLANAPFGQGGSWSSRGTILFAPDRTGTLYEVTDRGGPPRRVTTLDPARGELSHQWPAFLPDGRHVVYLAWSERVAERGLYVADLESRERRWLGPADGGAVFAPPSHLLFTRAGMLVVQRFDTRELRLMDDPHVVEEHVCGSAAIMPPCFSASTTGMLVYQVARLFRHQLAWFTRSGRQSAVPMEPGSYFGPTLSPDGSRVLLDRHDPRTWRRGVWQFDLRRGVLSRLFEDTVVANDAVWSPDGRALAFSANTADRHEIYTVNAQGGVPQRWFSAPKSILLTDWSRDGKQLLFQTRGDGARDDDVWVLPLDRAQMAFAYLHSRFGERQARFSPDGRWVAYSSDESGRPEVYVQPFPATGSKWQISNNGGHQPAWRHDGRELFYLSGDRRLMAASLRLATKVTVGSTSALFSIPTDAPIEGRISYAPAADGQRFLVNVAAPDRATLPPFETEVVVNWPATLRERR